MQETELTFVRCPGCRSLVPSSAARCRMCGEVLDNASSAQSDNGEPAETKSRIRQRTMSLPAEEVEAIKADAASNAGDGDAVTDAPADPTEEEVPFRLGGGADAIFGTAAQEDDSSWAEPEPSSETSDVQQESMNDFVDSLAEEAAREMKSELEALGGGDFGQQPEFAAEPAEAVEEPEPEHVPDEPAKKKRRRRRRKKTRDGQKAKDVQSPVAEPSAQEFVEPEAEVVEDHVEEVEEIVMDRVETKDRESLEPISEIAFPEEGGLAGWLVRYDGSDSGAATEIRTGRFFICGEQLKDTDLVVKKKSVSTPHCVVKSSFNEGLLVQDLLSDGGTFIRRRNQDKFFKYTETVKLDHGDWLRVGEQEFLVCLVRLPKRKN